MKKRKITLVGVLSLLILCATFLSCRSHSQAETDSAFIRVKQGQFFRGGKPYYFIGTNFWYGAILGSEGCGGDRARLIRELDMMKEKGIENLRVLVGAEGLGGIPSRIEPTLQKYPGEYNDTIFEGLDFLLSEMGKREMTAVLYLTNSWGWSGGWSVYLKWAGLGEVPEPDVVGWTNYQSQVSRFLRNDSTKAMYARHVEKVVTRTNTITGKRYIDDPAIFSWQLCNEPRPFGEISKPAFSEWVAATAAQIKALDPNHMVSVGSEGKWGCDGDVPLCEKIHSDPNVDYLTFHLWPFNWSWINKETVIDSLNVALREAKAYMDMHVEMAHRLGKPAVMEEFGYPRDGFQFAKESPHTARDTFYAYVLGRVVQSAEEGDAFAGCNFWAWGGFANPAHEMWLPGDDYTGDPAQEQQGLNSVFASDSSTVAVISQACRQISQLKE
ncbi:MAG: cellulase family glycosylhydrolase [Bacteroidaceae bacterium]|nr:cellulase family glycosylhydrolase [Bacteroidaceae bacterium]